jgi:hypothetical protein
VQRRQPTATAAVPAQTRPSAAQAAVIGSRVLALPTRSALLESSPPKAAMQRAPLLDRLEASLKHGNAPARDEHSAASRIPRLAAPGFGITLLNNTAGTQRSPLQPIRVMALPAPTQPAAPNITQSGVVVGGDAAKLAMSDEHAGDLLHGDVMQRLHSNTSKLLAAAAALPATTAALSPIKHTHVVASAADSPAPGAHSPSVAQTQVGIGYRPRRPGILSPLKG